MWLVNKREKSLVIGFLLAAFVDRNRYVTCRCGFGHRVREGSFCPLEQAWERLGYAVAPKCLGCGLPVTGVPTEKALRFGAGCGYGICYICTFRHWVMHWPGPGR